jgi:rhamnosyltransferase
MPAFGVIVTYQTEPARLDQILARLAPQCRFVVADNSEDAASATAIRQTVARHDGLYLTMSGNLGIAAAQNAAIEAAWRAGADHVLLLDDDSVPAADLLQILSTRSSPVPGERAVFCANALDTQGLEIGNVRGRPGPMPRCRDMMSSGSLIPRDVFEAVGPFDASLFIDCVDFDWGWRAQALGIGIYVTRATAITHRLGEGRVRGLRFPSPIRHYYQFRNILRLMGRPHVPTRWRAAQALKLPTKLLLIPLLMPEPGRRLRFALAGVRDALRGRAGKWNANTARAHASPGAGP